MSDQEHWKHCWPCAEHVSEFLMENEGMIKDRIILELGSGATGLCGMMAAKLGARIVYLTDHPNIGKASEILKENVDRNEVGDVCQILGLDWDSPESVLDVLSKIDELDCLVASDVFFDPSTFIGLVNTFGMFMEKFTNLIIWFGYQERDDNWTCAELLREKFPYLEANLIRKIETGQHTIQLAAVVNRHNSMVMYAGIEGGGTKSKLVIVDESGEKRIWSDSHGTNYYLQGVEVVGDQVAKWIRQVAKDNQIGLPLESLGMGLSGAEDEEINQKFVEYLKQIHGDISKEYFLTSDAVSTVAANFDNQGIVLIAGTGSSCRMLMSNGDVKGAGGWGHSIGDGSSAYWIANRAIRTLFDDDDGLEKSEHSVERIRQLLCSHFKISEKIGILDFLYAKFEKHRIAEFTKILAENNDDLAIQRIFEDGGKLLGKHVHAVTRHLSDEERKVVDIVMVGSVFKSWDLLRNGFISSLQFSGINTIRLYEPSENPAIGAAAIAAKKLKNVSIGHAKHKILKDTIEFS